MKKIKLLFVAVLASLAVMALTSCQEGVTREERIEMFKADILAGNNPREHFEGHPNASTGVDSNTFDAVQWTPGDSIAFPGGDTIGSSTFEIMYTNSTYSTPTAATGTFHKISSTTGDEWYIYQINVDGTLIPAD